MGEASRITEDDDANFSSLAQYFLTKLMYMINIIIYYTLHVKSESRELVGKLRGYFYLLYGRATQCSISVSAVLFYMPMWII
jgi:hypothetical protein